MENKIIGKYKIIYGNGMTQIKSLIKHSDFLEIINPTKDLIHELQLKKKEKEVSILKNELKEMFGEEYFTDKSPIYKALNTNILELPIGNFYCKLQLI